jgi:hypothetical protein
MGGALSPFSLNAEMKNVTAYRVQVKIKPNIVITIPMEKICRISEYNVSYF